MPDQAEARDDTVAVLNGVESASSFRRALAVALAEGAHDPSDCGTVWRESSEDLRLASAREMSGVAHRRLDPRR
jgi:hypothetical protein